MKKLKRIIITTLSGILFGCVCVGLASSGPGDLPLPVMLQLLTSRMLIGFAIGISSLKLGHWSVHGLAMGFLFSLPLAFGGLMAPENPEFTAAAMFISTIVMGMIYGLLTEVIATVLFKAKMENYTTEYY